ncbi:MAG: hypothetical protein ACPG31_02580 [Planctomycetota bacterium]
MRPIPRLAPCLGLAAVGLCLFPSCSIPGGAAWSDLHVNGFVSAFPGELDATARDISVDATTGGGLAFTGDLDVDPNRETAFLYGARGGFAPFELIVSEFGYDGTSSGLATGGVTFLGVALPVADTLATDVVLDMNITKLMLGIDIVNTPVARVGVLAGVDFFTFDRFAASAAEDKSVLGVPVISRGDTQNILINEDAPIPIVGLRGDVQLPFGVRLGGEITGLSANFDDADIKLTDIDINANYEPWSNVELVLGYRLIDVSIDGEISGTALDADLDLSGPYVGVSLYW